MRATTIKTFLLNHSSDIPVYEKRYTIIKGKIYEGDRIKSREIIKILVIYFSILEMHEHFYSYIRIGIKLSGDNKVSLGLCVWDIPYTRAKVSRNIMGVTSRGRVFTAHFSGNSKINLVRMSWDDRRHCSVLRPIDFFMGSTAKLFNA